MKLFSIFEAIKRDEAKTDLDSLQTVIDGKRDVGFITIDKSIIDFIEENGIRIIPVRMVDNNTMVGIIYRDGSKHRALDLYQIAKSKGGYLKDETPKEAEDIGALLGYHEDDVRNYVWRKYHQQNVPSDDPNDYSDFH